MELLAVTGMVREAKLLAGAKAHILISGGGSNAGLEQRLETAVADGARAILSFGIAGGLSPELQAGTLVVARHVVDGDVRYACDSDWHDGLLGRLSDAHDGALAGTDTILRTPAEKARWHTISSAVAADMESHITARVAARHGLPFAVLRAISDGPADVLPPAVTVAMGPDGRLNPAALARALLRNPLQIPGLIATGRNSGRAFAALLRGLSLLGPGLGCPYLG